MVLKITALATDTATATVTAMEPLIRLITEKKKAPKFQFGEKG